MSRIHPHWPPGHGPACPLCRKKTDAPCLLLARQAPDQSNPSIHTDLIHVACIERASASVSHGMILAAIESDHANAGE
jgi:hypothetical protein